MKKIFLTIIVFVSLINISRAQYIDINNKDDMEMV